MVHAEPQGGGDGFAFTNPRLVERYLKSEIYILVHFRTSEITKEYAACFQRKGRIPKRDPVVLGESGESHIVKSWIGSPLLQSGFQCESLMTASIEKTQYGSSGKKQPMFVTTVKLMESPQNSVPSLVWFDVVDNVYPLLPHALHFSSKSGLVVRGGRSATEYWESRQAANGVIVCPDQCTGEVVECGSECLQSVSSGEQYFSGGVVHGSEAVKWLLGLSVNLDIDKVGLSSDETIQCGIEPTDVLFGPLDL